MNHVLIALSQYGVSENKTGDNPVILNYAKECGMDQMPNDEMSWCSIFMNWVAFKCGLPMSHSPAARSWLNVGVQVTDPQMGDVAVLWRVKPDSWQGHVGIFISYGADKKIVFLLGGNQGDKVWIVAFPVEQVLQFRRIHT